MKVAGSFRLTVYSNRATALPLPWDYLKFEISITERVVSGYKTIGNTGMNGAVLESASANGSADAQC